jgi:hypothetical protein
MSAFLNHKGEPEQVQLTPEIYRAAHDANLSVPAFLNREYGSKTDRAKHGDIFKQMCVSEGIYIPGRDGMDLRAATVGDILDGKASLTMGAATTQQRNTDYGGTQARILFPAAVVDIIESTLKKDLVTDLNLFNSMISLRLGVASDTFEQPMINYQTNNGPDGAARATAQRVAQLATPPAMAVFTTSQTPRRLPTFSMGAEFSQQALKTATLDLVALSLARFMQVEEDARVYEWLSNLWSGDLDFNMAAISAVTTTSLDALATGGVLTHKAWVKWLYRQRKYRRLTHAVCDIDTYFKIEGRTGRPGAIGLLDPTLPKIAPEGMAQNPYVDNVKIMLVDAAIDGGPVPANTIWGVDSRFGIVKVSNTSAAYSAAETFAMKRSEAFRIDTSESVYRQWDAAFDVLTIA